ncbi:IS481 family transposase [Archaeoglobus veneficus]|uniref:Integrase catalytic region n=1 Tax=Archaeoglobus veneficus (strain DSM 11195 / SNP6) TaxID=693661 RepID=F2KMT1_ARCVS|nr:IS481 family transposase [Archaeoglobus veneficus]AEA46105.1 Integrase catalytic region [Archaeoglobus veneficus SNP6]
MSVGVFKGGSPTCYLNKGTPVREIAAVMRVTPRRIYQLKKQYEETGKIPELKQAGRKPKLIDPDIEQIVLQAYHKYKLSPVTLEKLIERDYGIHIPHNTIYKIMLKNNLVEENMNKKKQRRWVRFERKHSMSLWQGDWKKLGNKWIIAFMDDASRFITCYGIFDSATAENTIKVLKKGFAEFGIPDEILTDHGTQFVAAKSREKAKHRFKDFLAENGVKHILARVSHPQTNGKIERFFGLMEQKLSLFDSVDEFVYWYNFVKPHMSLNFDELETPYQAFLRKLPAERVFEYGRWLFEE